MCKTKILLHIFLFTLASCGPLTSSLEGKWVDAAGKTHFQIFKDQVEIYNQNGHIDKYSMAEINIARKLLIFGNDNEEMSYRTFFKNFTGDSIELIGQNGSNYMLFKKSL